jgi:hypothetical protein
MILALKYCCHYLGTWIVVVIYSFTVFQSHKHYVVNVIQPPYVRNTTSSTTERTTTVKKLQFNSRAACWIREYRVIRPNPRQSTFITCNIKHVADQHYHLCQTLQLNYRIVYKHLKTYYRQHISNCWSISRIFVQNIYIYETCSKRDRTF